MGGTQAELPGMAAPEGVVAINARCLVRTDGEHRVVLVGGLPIAQYSAGDRMAETYAMVSLVEQGWAQQGEVAHAFAITTRTLRRHQRRFEEGGLAALGHAGGCPKGTPRVPRARAALVSRLKADGMSNREIASRVGVSEKAIRKLLHRLGWRAPGTKQEALPLPGADPNLSAPAGSPVENPPAAPAPSADPNLSATAAPSDVPFSADRDPANRQVDRLLARIGLLDDAAPLFRPGDRVPRAGVLLAIPALVQSGVLDVAREVYGSIGPAFYGLRTSVVALLLMALLRIKRPEGLKEHSPADLGRVLGLDRAPEVKTLRRKLARLAATSRATEFGRLLARRRVEARGAAMGFLYIDGHVRVYHGHREIPKAHVARMRLPMPATTDYWVNDAAGVPLFVVTAEANAGLAKMLWPLCDEIRNLVGERRITIVFDRGGWSPKLFAALIVAGFDVLTYRKGKTRNLPKKLFAEHTLQGTTERYTLADRGIVLLGGKLRLRQVTRLTDTGHQTHIVTSRRDLPAVEIAFRMFERWRQENLFKYLREEYALDALADYADEPDDPTREVPNPKWAEVDAKLRAARQRVEEITRRIGADATLSALGLTPSKRSLLPRPLRRELGDAIAQAMELARRRERIPRRIPVGQRQTGPVIKLAVERKHLTNVLKMVAYQAESDLVRALAPHYKRAEDEGRTLIHSALGSAADLRIEDGELRVTLAPLSSPHRTRAVAALCAELNAATVRFPGTRLRVHYAVAETPTP